MTKLLETPCVKCEWKYQGFHVCLGRPKRVMQQVEDSYERDSNGEMIVKHEPKVRTHREAISASLRAKHASDPKKIARDQEIVRLYEEADLSIKQISEHMMLNPRTVMSALHRAEDNGLITMRPQGQRIVRV